MIVTDAPWPNDCCPRCLVTDSIELASRLRLCLNCQNEWNPAEVTGPLNESLSVPSESAAASESVPTEFYPESDLDAQLKAAREAYLGRRVIVHDYGEPGKVVEILDNGFAVVEMAAGFMVSLLPDEFSLDESEAALDDAVVMLGSVDITVAALVIKAAIETLVGEGDEQRLGLPPDGWLVPDPEAWLVVEHGAAYAVAVLANMFGITKDQLQEIADKLATTAIEARGDVT